LTMVASVRRSSRILPTQVSLNNQSVLPGERATEYAPSAPIQPSVWWKRASRSGAGTAVLTTGGPAMRRSGTKAIQTTTHDRIMATSLAAQDYTRGRRPPCERSGPPHLRACRTSANLLRSHRLRQVSLGREDEM